MLWEYAIDAGSESLRLVKRGATEILREPNRAALRAGREMPFAWGERALKLAGRAPQGVRVIKTASDGCISEPSLVGKWTRVLISEDDEILKRGNVLVAVSPAMRKDAREELQKRMIDEDIAAVGLVNSAVAAAMGAGENVMEPEGMLLLDIGAEQIVTAVISGGRTLRAQASAQGAVQVKRRLTERVREDMGFLISEESASEILNEMTSENPDPLAASEKPGFDYKAMLPLVRSVRYAYAFEAVSALQEAAVQSLMQIIGDLPEEIAGDITRRGVLLTGGGARFPGMAAFVQERLKLPVSLAEAPEKCVAKGLIRILNSQKTYRHLIEDEMEAVRRP